MPAENPPGRLRAPAGSLAGFPGVRLAGASLFRIHRAENSPWWFSDDGSGRFDLPARSGRGTCYLAHDPAGAFLEVFRHWTIVPEAEVEIRRISPLTIEEALLADCTSPRSRRFGLTAEIHSTPDYRVTQRWAAAFAEAGFDGIRHYLRHDPSQRLIGVALFGPAGSPPWPAPLSKPLGDDLLAAVERHFGIRVLPVPGASPRSAQYST